MRIFFFRYLDPDMYTVCNSQFKKYFKHKRQSNIQCHVSSIHHSQKYIKILILVNQWDGKEEKIKQILLFFPLIIDYYEMA